ncbi:MAG: cysteine hydrolase [Acidobacteriia bacterium]|nr:cysteine hydrolase [Terriglobia bacterium]
MTEHEQCIGILRMKNESPIELDPSKTALIVVDMQRYFTQSSFPFTDVFEKIAPGVCSGYLRRVSEIVIPNIQRLLAHFRERGSSIVYTAIGSAGNDGDDLPFWLRSFDDVGVGILGSRIWPLIGDPSWEIDGALKPRPDEIVLNKLSAGAFATTDLEHRLRNHDVEYVVVTGVATDVCVSTTAREAADRNFKVVVVGDACTTFSEDLHQANIETLQSFGWIRSTETVVGITRKIQAAV